MDISSPFYASILFDRFTPSSSAIEARLPAYVIFHDSVLCDMAH
jgi:hypothetical protein